MKHMHYYIMALVAMMFFSVAIFFIFSPVLSMPDGNRRYIAQYIPFSEDAAPAAPVQEELRFSGHKAFYACGETGGSRMLDIGGELIASVRGHISFVVKHVERSKSMAGCLQNSPSNPSTLAAYEGETVQLRKLPSPEGSVCFYHYEADIIKCLSRF